MTLINSLKTDRSDMRIFVQIPAYRDKELAKTLLDLYGKASRPDRLHVCVLWQRASDEQLPHSVRRLSQLELIEVPYEHSLGCNWARSVVQKRYRGEQFTLMIDSHHRFKKNWDELLIDMHGSLKNSGVRRPIITGYMPRYDPENDPRGRQRQPYKIYPKGYEAGLLIHLTSYAIASDVCEPVPAQFASGHFIFAEGEFNKLVPMDPNLYFTGDEVAIALRAFTHGFELFHPHVVVGWHLYNRATRVTHWDDHEFWWQLHRTSLGRLRRLFLGRLKGRYGLGEVRSVQDFQQSLLMPLIYDQQFA